VGERIGVCLSHRIVLDRSGRDQAPSPGGAVGLPQSRQVAGLHPVVAGVAVAGDGQTFFLRLGFTRTARAGDAGPSGDTLPHQPRRLGYRQAAGVDAHVGEAARVHGASLAQDLLQQASLPASAEKPLLELIPASPQTAYGQGRLRDHVSVHAVARVDDAGHDDAPGTCRPEIRHHGPEVLRLHPVPPRIRPRLGVAHAQLVDIYIAGSGPALGELGENLPADRALTGSRRPAQPQDRDQVADHNASAGPEPMIRMVTAAFSRHNTRPGHGLRL
jgi:hypothetical protein